MVGHGISQRVFPASHAVARSLLAALTTFHRLYTNTNKSDSDQRELQKSFQNKAFETYTY